MSNIPVNNSQPNSIAPSDSTLIVEVQAHDADRPFAVSLPTEFVGQVQHAVRAAALARGYRIGMVDVAIVDDAQIHLVNRQHLNHDWDTDVISFPYESEIPRLEGELIVSWETARRQSLGTGWPAMTELLLYVVHGTLHLTGMDDIDTESRQAMRQQERELLQFLQLEGWNRYDVDHHDSGVEPSSGDTAVGTQE